MIHKSALGPWVAHLRMKGKQIIPPSVYARKSLSDVGVNKSMQNVTARWGYFLPQNHCLSKFGKVPLGDATHKALRFQTILQERSFHMNLIKRAFGEFNRFDMKLSRV